MADPAKNERSPINLSLPETTKIAAPLAEVMPSFAPATAAPFSILTDSKPPAVPVVEVPLSPVDFEELEADDRMTFEPPPFVERPTTPEVEPTWIPTEEQPIVTP